MKWDVLIAGVGGQGQVLASRLLGAAAIDAGLFARTSETIGMSQRGGCVTSSVRIGGGFLSSAVPLRGADLILGFELCETVRALPRLSPNGAVVVSTQVLSPVSVSLGLAKYDADKMTEYLKTHVQRLVLLDAQALAEKVGSVRAANVVMLGAACGAGFLPFDREKFEAQIARSVKPQFKSLNENAFEQGFLYAASHSGTV